MSIDYPITSIELSRVSHKRAYELSGLTRILNAEAGPNKDNYYPLYMDEYLANMNKGVIEINASLIVPFNFSLSSRVALRTEIFDNTPIKNRIFWRESFVVVRDSFPSVRFGPEEYSDHDVKPATFGEIRVYVYSEGAWKD